MNLNITDEEITRSRSPKRYSLNRKVKEKERLQCSLKKRVKSPSILTNVSVTVACGGTNVKGSRMESTMTKGPSIPTPQVCTNEAHPLSTSLGITTPAAPSAPSASYRPASFPMKPSHLSYRRKPENHVYNQIPWPSCTPSYRPHFGGNFHGMWSMPPQNPYQVGLINMGPATALENIPHNNHFMQCYMAPVQSQGFLIGQNSAPGDCGYNAFTSCGNPFTGIVWRPN